jgi:tetratricopeptide (TPR) repeat protein
MMLRDSVTLLVLVLATVALYAITSFLFRTFSAHRAALAKEYAASGRALLSANQPDQAIDALRVSLSYDPDDTANHLLFAEALARAHHTEEATNYFVSLRDAQPADGFINLQLARLARERHDPRQAVDYYRDASLGNWQNDGISARRQVQLELAAYLIQNGDLGAARSEILVAAANAPETPGLDMTFGDLLQQANDPGGALAFYRKAATLDRHSFAALYKAGTVAYRLGSYADAAGLLSLALKQTSASQRDTPEVARATELEASARRILSLSLADDLPPRERVDHLRSAAAIAKMRVADCAAHLGSATPPPQLLALVSQWQAASRFTTQRIPLDDTNDQDAVAHLIFNSEIQTARLCGPPSGDDALLLLLAHAAQEGQ